ncbi:MAG: glycosyl transferase, partial [SAR324 cluster bacterium]|nr:glycosyl transferase [SAR324 cluster bacterium]
FKDFLISNDIVFICKLHPFEEKLFVGKFSGNHNRFLLISNKTLVENDIDLYRLIGSVDLLITDYSSVYFDYLLLNKPMVFTPTDLEEYEKKRGFLLEPYGFWTPGPKATNQQQLQDEILRSLEDPDYYRKERETINNIINHYKDDRSCERVTQLIMEKLNRKK